VLTGKIKTPIHAQSVADKEPGQTVTKVTRVAVVVRSKLWKNLNIFVGTVTTLYYNFLNPLF
jgi:hypothetical protein